MNKSCSNCFYLTSSVNNGWEPYSCELHGSNASVTHPATQFCGSEYWVSDKIKKRIENLEKLGI